MLLRSLAVATLALPVAASLYIPVQQQPKKLSEEERAAHALTRLTFGARPGDMQRVLEMGVDRWIEAQLAPETISDSALTSALASLAPNETLDGQGMRFVVNASGTPGQRIIRIDSAGKVITMTTDSSTKMAPAEFQKIMQRVVFLRRGGGASRAEQARWLTRAEVSDQQLLEVMTDFWENHFSVFGGKMPGNGSLTDYDERVIRPRALGKFRDLLGAVAMSPAMLHYLDNRQSGADPAHSTLKRGPASAPPQNGATPVRPRAVPPTGLNENYARELMELHTLGVDGGYTQQDVMEVARALTGWTVLQNASTSEFWFDSTRHDSDEKTVLGMKLAAGRGLEDGNDVLDMLARHPSTAKFIARKLAIRFISDTPSERVVDEAAATFTRTDGDIRETLRTILKSPEFFSRDAYRAKVKNHVEWMTSLRRVLGAERDTSFGSIEVLTQIGQPLFGRATPDGWPETASAWLNFSSMFTRVDMALKIARNEVPAIPLERWVMWNSLVAAPFDKQVDGVVQHILLGDASAATRKSMEAAKPAADTPEAKAAGLRELVGLALSAPEFQRR